MQENCPRNYIHFLNAQKLEGKYYLYFINWLEDHLNDLCYQSDKY